MPRMVVTHSDSHPRDFDLLAEEFPDYDIEGVAVPAGGLQAETPPELTAALAGADVLLLRPGLITESVLDAAPDLKLVALTGSGYDHVDVAAATERGIVVVHSPEVNAPDVVEHVLGCAFSLLRDLPEKFDGVAAGGWDRVRTDVRNLRYATVGVVGLGTIGFDVARQADYLGADVVGYDPHVTGETDSRIYPRHDRETVEDAGVDLVEDLSVLCERADIVTLHVPLTDATQGMIGRAELDRLGDGYLINTARGGVVDETALAAALTDGALRGAALDVLASEPPSPDNPLLDCSNAYITPHIASNSDKPVARAYRIVGEKIRRTLRGERVDTVVNPAVFERDALRI